MANGVRGGSVLSDSARDTDLGRKLRAYSRFGVGEYWIIDPDEDTVQVFQREGAGLVDRGTVGVDQEVAFLGMTLKVSKILAR